MPPPFPSGWLGSAPKSLKQNGSEPRLPLATNSGDVFRNSTSLGMSPASTISFGGGFFSWDRIFLAPWVAEKYRSGSEVFTPLLFMEGEAGPFGQLLRCWAGGRLVMFLLFQARSSFSTFQSPRLTAILCCHLRDASLPGP